MEEPGWLTRSQADLPAGDGWLSARERETLAGLRVAKRRADWRLGRWTAKTAVARRLGADPAAVEIAAAPDGAPLALVGGTPAPVALSLSHRAGRALAVVGAGGTALGCDLEVADPRSAAFVATWLAPTERALVESAGRQGATVVANALWTAKEAAAKGRREGLRLDPRTLTVSLDGEPPDGGWRALTVRMPAGSVAGGWWRDEPEWVMAVVAWPAPAPPVAL
jgi:4'-phosphopantetheinyl transferase